MTQNFVKWLALFGVLFIAGLACQATGTGENQTTGAGGDKYTLTFSQEIYSAKDLDLLHKVIENLTVMEGEAEFTFSESGELKQTKGSYRWTGYTHYETETGKCNIDDLVFPGDLMLSGNRDLDLGLYSIAIKMDFPDPEGITYTPDVVGEVDSLLGCEMDPDEEYTYAPYPELELTAMLIGIRNPIKIEFYDLEPGACTEIMTHFTDVDGKPIEDEPVEVVVCRN